MVARLRGVRAKELIRALETGGFDIMRQKGSHVVMHDAGTDKTVVVPSHSAELPRWLLNKISKDAGLDEDEFRSLI
jgi:predicted RNA binding protein YcfA (HicA-like mRNA interferase family)